jgi:hypothetical protein
MLDEQVLRPARTRGLAGIQLLLLRLLFALRLHQLLLVIRRPLGLVDGQSDLVDLANELTVRATRQT